MQEHWRTESTVQKRLSPIETAASVGLWPDLNLQKIEIRTAIEQLPTGFRTVLSLYDLEGFKHEEIADLLGISVGTSKSQLSRARALLRTQLEKN